MDKDKLRGLLEDLRAGRTNTDDVLEALKSLPFEDLGFAHLDHHRSLRKGFPEVIFCRGKTVEQVAAIVQRLSLYHDTILASRADAPVYEAVKAVRSDLIYNETAKMILIGKMPKPRTPQGVLVVTAGTSDIPVAEEAAFTAEAMGSPVERLFDVGVAGIHRLFGNMERLFDAAVIVVVAGMDGALPSIIGGLVSAPVIAVPTSVGYGASFGGIAALLTMLNSCAPGVAVMNIDNGFGAGYMAGLINAGKKTDEDRIP